MTPSAWMPDLWAKTLVPTIDFQAGTVRAEAAADVLGQLAEAHRLQTHVDLADVLERH